MRQLRVLVLMHDEVVPPPDAHRRSAAARWEYAMEFAVVRTLRALGHDVHVLGIADALGPIADALARLRPHVVFNIVSFFHDVAAYEANVVAFLELCKQPYTGCNALGLALAGDKVLTRQLLAANGIPQPAHAVFARGERAKTLPAHLAWPVIVKPAAEHGSAGIAQSSVVTTDRQLAARVAFVRRSFGGDVLVEQFLPGREFSVGVLGNDTLTAFPARELTFAALPAGQRAIATERVKWDLHHQRRVGLGSARARGLPEALARELRDVAVRTFRALRLSGYARIDLRLDARDRVHVLEANANSDLTPGEDFPEAARGAGLGYAALLQRVVALGMRYRARWH
jgi:D-alanine-D-alanine ligase